MKIHSLNSYSDLKMIKTVVNQILLLLLGNLPYSFQKGGYRKYEKKPSGWSKVINENLSERGERINGI